MASQDNRQFQQMALGGNQIVPRLRPDQYEPPAQFMSTADGNACDMLGASLVNGSGSAYARAVSPFFSPPKSSCGGGGSFVY